MKQRKWLTVFVLALCAAAMLFSFSSCNKNPAEGLGDTVYVEIDMQNGDYIKLELYPGIAPITVANFVDLCNRDFYAGIQFHRVIYGFMIQAGDPTATGAGGSDKCIKGEFQNNGIQNLISHERGVISMARRSNDYNSASSQFFIMHQTAPHLDGDYAAFGRVIEGMEVVDKIASVSTDSNDKPLAGQFIKTIRVISEEAAKTPGAAPDANTVSTDSNE